MKRNNLLVLIFTVLLAVMPGPVQAQGDTNDTENFIFVNYIGQELNLDLDDTLYRIPGTDTMPEGGRLALTLPFGEHKYAANVAGVGGSAGLFDLQPGDIVAKAARIEQTAPQVKDGILIEKPRDYVFLFDFDPNAPVAEAVPVEDIWVPNLATAGQSSLVWVNYIGDELTVDLNGQLHIVPAQSGTIPGRLQIGITPGTYTYTASVPQGSINGELSLGEGQVLGVNISAELPEDPVYDVGDTFDTTPDLVLRKFVEDLTMKATPPAGLEVVDDEPSVGMAPEVGPSEAVETILVDHEGQSGLTVNNFVGEDLVLTIKAQAYTIPYEKSHTVFLPPGSYTYTASTPFAAANGVVDLSTARATELSIVTNVAHDLLTVYQN